MRMKSLFGKKNSIVRDNKGSAMIVCIIVLLFVSILATVILYMSGINYRMKKTDLNTRISFYTSEIPLERMQSNLIVPVSEAMNIAYMRTNSRYANLLTADARRRYFYTEFEKEFKKILLEQYGGASVGTDGSTVISSTLIKNILHNLTYTGTPTPSLNPTGLADGIPVSDIVCNDGVITDAGYANNPIGFINTYSSIPGNFPGNSDGSAKMYMVCTDQLYGYSTAQDYLDAFVVLDVEDTAHPGVLKNEKECRVLIKNVGVVTIQNGYRSIVTTDIAIQFPPLDWSSGFSTSDYHNWNMYQLIYYVNWQKS